VEEDDFEAVKKIAEHIHRSVNKFEILNRLSFLPESKAKMRMAIKERIRVLGAAYVSLATFVDDDDVDFLMRYKKRKRSKAILLNASRSIRRYEKEMKKFTAL
jgi:hypothetical protein